MNPDETSCTSEICVVCGKDTSGGRGFMTLHLEGRQIPLCCPMCQKVYGEKPAFYNQRQQTREAIHDIERTLGMHSPE